MQCADENARYVQQTKRLYLEIGNRRTQISLESRPFPAPAIVILLSHIMYNHLFSYSLQLHIRLEAVIRHHAVLISED